MEGSAPPRTEGEFAGPPSASSASPSAGEGNGGGQPIIDIDLFDPRSYARGIPHAAFARLRAECPVYWQQERALLGWPAGPGYWAVTKHADVVYVNRTPELFSSHLGATQIRDPATQEDLAFVQKMMLNMDPPEHTRLRRLVSLMFTPRNVERLRDGILRRTKAIIDDVADRGECDFPYELSADLPLLTLAEVLGMPTSDRKLLFDWSNRIIGFQDEEYGQVSGHAPSASSDAPASSAPPVDPRSRAALTDMFEYAHGLAEHKREHPGDDLITVLLQAEIDGRRVSDEEFENFFFLLAVAGNETLRTSIPGGMLALFEHPDQRARLLAEPTLLPTAIEEMLRWVSPVMSFRRTATRDTELRGRQIKAGQKVVVYYASANRDEDVFQDPDVFNVARRPNNHLSFGVGPHVCLGASLARLQMGAFFGELLWRLPDMELAGPVQRLQSNFQAGIKHMPVRWTAERPAS